MIEIHGSLPEEKPGFMGEYFFAKACTEVWRDDPVHVWFQIEHLPGIPEVDAVLIHAELGMFIVEVKGHSIGQIDRYELGEFWTTPTPNQASSHKKPIKQVKASQYQLKAKFETLGAPPPWMQVAISFPNIRRSDWESKFGKSLLADTFLFSEDISNRDAFHSALKSLSTKPLTLLPPSNINLADANRLANAIAILDDKYSRKLQPTAEEERAIRQPRDNFRSKAAKYVDMEGATIYVRGKAGTGKTLFLLEWAQQCVEAGKQVLLVTFNLSLASSLRSSLFGVSLANKSLKTSIQVASAHSLAIEIAEAANLKSIGSGYSKWFTTIAANAGNPEIPTFDCIAIDEAQDWSDEMLEMLNAISTPQTTWMAAVGQGQELYRDGKDWPFPIFEQHGNGEPLVEPLKRSFRSGKSGTQIPIALDEHFPSVEKATSWLSSNWQDEVEGEDLFGEVAQSAKTDWVLAHFGKSDDGNAFQEIRWIVEDFCRDSLAAHNASRAAIVFLNSSSSAIAPVRRVLRELGVAIIDHLEKHERTTAPQPGEMLLTTMRLIRGLEADAVLLFDLARLTTAPTTQLHNPKNLAYIALSRHKRLLRIVVDSRETMDCDEMSFVNFVREVQTKMGLRTLPRKAGKQAND